MIPGLKKLLKSIRSKVLITLRLRKPKKAGPYPTLEELLGEHSKRGKEPKLMLDINLMLKTNEIKPKGVIHIGANNAAELEEYLKMGFQKILYIEANPALIPALKVKASLYPGLVYVAHAAACEVDGFIKLHITSKDQSSSILPLGKHLDIYPKIKEVGLVEVPSRRLDTLLHELNLDPGLFNFLNIDIQGAELLALKGSVELLKNIQAVNTEVNLEELYKGCAILHELEGFMSTQGFNRSAMVTPYHPSWGDAFYVRKPVVTMKSLGLNGRFANQLFQYMFLRLVAKKQGAIVQTPPWIGQELFGLTEPDPVLQLPEWREGFEAPKPGVVDNSEWVWTKFYKKSMQHFESVDFWGHYMGQTGDIENEREFVRSIFKFVPKFEKMAEEKISLIRSKHRFILTVHLRRGDYGKGFFYRTPCSWYEKWLSISGLNSDEWAIYICSEDPELYRERFSGYKVITRADLEVSPVLATYFDFYVMTKADYVLSANSSYSFMASMLNENAKGFARPSFEHKSLITYDPWNAPVLLRHVPKKDEHEKLIYED
jgi:FkbM family methyltransferase